MVRVTKFVAAGQWRCVLHHVPDTVEAQIQDLLAMSAGFGVLCTRVLVHPEAWQTLADEQDARGIQYGIRYGFVYYRVVRAVEVHADKACPPDVMMNFPGPVPAAAVSPATSTPALDACAQIPRCSNCNELNPYATMPFVCRGCRA